MRHAVLLALVVSAVSLQAQRHAPVGISRAELALRDTLTFQDPASAPNRSGALLKESAAGIAGSLIGVAYAGASLMVCDNSMPVDDGHWLEDDIRVNCMHQTLIGIGVVGPIGAALFSSIA